MSALLSLTDETFEKTITGSPLPVLVDLWAPWCDPCRELAPVVEELADELAGRLTVAKLNVDENQAAPARLSVLSIPTLLLFKDGQEVKRLVGARLKNDLKAALEPWL